MDINKKLFLVTLQYQAYVLAEDDCDAEDFTGDITDNERPKIKVEEVRLNVLRWPGHACVYHAEQYDRDIKVEECLPPQ